MRFGLVGPAHPLRGGIAQYNGNLAWALQNAGHEALLVSFRKQYPALLFPGRTQLDPSEPVFSIRPHPLLTPFSPLSWARAADLLGRQRPDALVIHWWHPFFGPAYTGLIDRLRRNQRVRILFLCHNIYPHERPAALLRFFEKGIIRRTFRRADGFLVHSESMRDQLRSLGVSNPIRRIHHPVYDFYGRWDTDSPARRSSGGARLLFFGNIREYKGLPILLAALGQIGSRLDFRLTVAGEFYSDPKAIRESAQRLGIAHRVEWLDRYIPNEEVPALFRNADLVVLPYLAATQSGIVPLAYHFDKPVVASDVGGLREVVLEGKTGYLVPPGDVDSLARCLINFFREERFDRYRDEIRVFRQGLSWDQVTDTILNLLSVDLD